MKILLMLAFFYCAVNIVYSQQRYAYLPEGKTTFQTSTEKILISIKPGANLDNLKKYISDSSKLSDAIIKKWNILSLKKEYANTGSLKMVLDHLKKDNSLLYAAPFLIYEDGTLQGLTNQVIVRLKLSIKSIEADAIYKSLHIKSIQKDAYIDREYVLTIDNTLQPDALDIANTLYETGLFEFSEPDFVKVGVFKTVDPVYNTQWGLQNTGQYHGTAGADINVNPAWAITTGAGIRVAIIDEGVDLHQPDLVGNLVAGFDALNLGSNGGPSGNDAHGTACAGIAAATTNNNLGDAGVAFRSSIVPVRAGQAETISSTSAATGINWAASATGGHADIISCSWGGGSSLAALNTAIANAISTGRGNRGCLILFSSGNNSNASISYPSNQPNVIAVGGSNMCDQRLNLTPTPAPNTCNYDTRLQTVGLAGGSDYGTGLGVVAPSINIATTDISGAAGFSSELADGWQMFNQDYVLNFDGTAAACPFAAGTMALILSENPSLTYSQATAILESSAAKVGGYNYTTNLTNGTWNNEMGYGRINACAAVARAITITGNSPVCTNSTFSVNVATGTLVTWSVSPTGYVNLAPNGAQVNLARIGTISGTVTLTAKINACRSTTTVTTSVQVGNSPFPTITINGIEPLQYGTQMDVTVNTTAAPPYLWYVNGTLVKTAYTTSTTINGGNNCNVTNSLQVSVSNSCGSSSNSTTYVRPCNGARFSVSPNPAHTSILITEDATYKPNIKSDQNVRITIIDEQNRVFGQYSFNRSKQYRINVASLFPGSYIVQINDGINIDNTKFIKQ